MDRERTRFLTFETSKTGKIIIYNLKKKLYRTRSLTLLVSFIGDGAFIFYLSFLKSVNYFWFGGLLWMLSSFILSMFVSVGKIIPLLATGESGNFHPTLNSIRECPVATEQSKIFFRAVSSSSRGIVRVVPFGRLSLGSVNLPPWILRGFAPTGPPPLRQKAITRRRNHHTPTPS